jgi:hypothetical protein
VFLFQKEYEVWHIWLEHCVTRICSFPLGNIRAFGFFHVKQPVLGCVKW